MKKILDFIKPYLLQLILAVVACISWVQVNHFGNRVYSGKGIFEYPNHLRKKEVLTDVDVTSGFDGGALAMGLICCVCIIMIVWIEINKSTKS